MKIQQLKYCRYSRKSSESKERQVASIEDQNSECDKTIIEEKLNVLYRFDESKTAFKPSKRDKFEMMIALIKQGKANAIITWKENRLARNPEEGGKLLQLLQDGVIQEIRCVATNTLYTQDSDHLILQIHFGMANQFSRNLSKDVKRGLEHKVERKEFPRAAIIGFEGFGDKGQRNIKPDPFEAPLIKKAFDMASTGINSLNTIGDTLYKLGLRTKKGKRVGKSHIEKILRNPLYYGYFYYKGELFEGNYTPIISKSLFDKVQYALSIRSKPVNHTWHHPYNALAHCADCGCSVTTTVKVKYYPRTDNKATYIYHHCTHRRGKCTQPAISTHELENELLKYIEQISLDKEVWSLGIKLLKAKHSEQTTNFMDKLSHLQKQYNFFQDKLNRLIAMRADEELTKEEFIVQKKLLMEEQANIKATMNDNQDSSYNWLELAENFLNTAFQARDIMTNGTSEEKKNLILSVGENLLLKDKKIVFTFRKPYDILLKPEYRTNVLAEVDSN